jgi:serine/threonine protein kinase
VLSGQLIAGRYRLDERIGAGGMGVVWRATDLELGRVVAVKRSQVGDNGQIRREARIGAGLHHPHAVTVFDVVQDGDERWLVMEYLPSRSLSEILADDGPLPPVVAARIGAQIASALVAMHERQMVHRDIKPGNVIIAEDGTAKLTDLGIARWAEVTGTGGEQLVGTPGYLAPEVADGHEAGPAADVYALGATLFAAVEGMTPTGKGDQGPFVQLRRAAEGSLEPMKNAGPLAPVLHELLRKSPDERPSARKAKDLLDEIGGTAVTLTALPRQRTHRRLAVALSAVAVVVAVLVAGYFYFLSDSPPAAAAGTVGDQRTFDPCSLLNTSTASRFGVLVSLDPEYGPFNRCGLLIKQTHDNEDLIDVELLIEDPPDYPALPFTPGQLGQVERFDEQDGKCKRAVRLSDGNQMLISVRHKDGRPAPLCQIAEAVTTDAYAVLSRGEIPRRTTPIPADSLGSLDACSLLTDADITKSVGVPGLEPDPTFGNWTCTWGTDPVEVDVAFERDYPPTAGHEPGDDGDPIKLGTKDAMFENRESGDDNNPICVVTIVHKRYEKEIGFNKQGWTELAEVSVETERDTPERLCEMAIGVARSVADKLPTTQ